MKFLRLPLHSSIGLTLAHSIPLPSKTIKKGTILTKEDILAITNEGIFDAMVVEFEQDDIDENEAAAAIAGGLIGPDTKSSKANTGRANIYATCSGLFKANIGAINRLNSLDDGITLSTVAINKIVNKGDLIATLKIIPYSLPKPIVIKALEQVKEVALFEISKWKSFNPLLITTYITEPNEALDKKTFSTLNTRLNRLGNTLSIIERSHHHEQELSKAIKMGFESGHNLLFIMGATATQDINDVVPSAINSAGGKATRFGMPVDPGNLIVVGHLGDMLIVGLPGCARSLQSNGFDWILERIIAGETITHELVNRLGVGGLLKEPPNRTSPREKAPILEKGLTIPAAAIVLAAGLSSRMEGGNKLLGLVKDKSVIRHTVENILSSGIKTVVVVLGNDADNVKENLSDLPVEFAFNPSFNQGQSTSIQVGIRALPFDTQCSFIVLGDMPFIKPATFVSLSKALNPIDGEFIVAPSYQNKRGNPVLWHQVYFDKLRNISGDKGAKEIILQSPDALKTINCDDPGVLIDLDTKKAFKAYE